MPELIGVTCGLEFDSALLEQHLLTFDRLAWFLAEDIASELGKPQDRADLQWLMERGLVVDPQVTVVDSRPLLSPAGTKEWEEIFHQIKTATHRQEPTYQPMPDLLCRMVAIQLRDLDKQNAVPLTSSWGLVPDQAVTRTEVIPACAARSAHSK